MALFHHFCWAISCLFTAIHSLNKPQSTIMIPTLYDVRQTLSSRELKTGSDQESKELINNNIYFTEQTPIENVFSDVLTKPTAIDTNYEYNNPILTKAITFRNESFTSDLNNAQKYDIPTKSNPKYDTKNYQSLQKVMESEDSVEKRDSHVRELDSPERSTPENIFSVLKLGRRIYHGHKTKIKHFPFLVTVHVFRRFVCGGSIIKPNLVITAASCLKRWQEWLLHNFTSTTTEGTTTKNTSTPSHADTHNVTAENVTTAHDLNYTSPSEHISVRIGTNYYRLDGKVVKVARVHFHPSYEEENLQNNLVILELERYLSFEHRNVKEIDIITNATDIVNGTSVTIVGWGAETYHNKVFNALWNLIHKAELTVINREQCIEIYTSKFVDNETNFCASNKYNEGACNCDAGDPAVADGVLVGVTSFGSPECGAPNATTVFTNLGYYTDWINDIINITKQNTTGIPQNETSEEKTSSSIETASQTYVWPCLRNGNLFYGSVEKCQEQNFQLDKLRSREYRRALEDSTQTFNLGEEKTDGDIHSGILTISPVMSQTNSKQYKYQSGDIGPQKSMSSEANAIIENNFLLTPNTPVIDNDTIV